MRRIICWLKGHDTVTVSVGGAGMFVLPGVGPVVEFVEDPDGDTLACRRCGKVRL